MIKTESQVGKQGKYCIKLIPADHAAVKGIEGIKGNANGYSFAMIESVPGKLLEFVGRPVTEIQGA